MTEMKNNENLRNAIKNVLKSGHPFGAIDDVQYEVIEELVVSYRWSEKEAKKAVANLDEFQELVDEIGMEDK